MLNQPWADKSTTPMVLVHVHRFHQPTNKTTHVQSAQTKSTVPRAICPNDINRSTRNPPKRNRRGGAYVPARTSAQRRFHTKIHALCAGNERWMRPRRATRAGTQAPPLPISIKPRGVPLPHYIVHSIAHANHTWCPLPHRIAYSIAPNHAVCPYPIGVILSIAQGWQV